MNMRQRTWIGLYSLVWLLALLATSKITVSAQPLDPAKEPLAIQVHPLENIIGVSNGYVFETYTPQFEFLSRLTLIDDPSVNPLLYNFRWSPDGAKLAVMLFGYGFEDTTSILQMWDTATSQKLYEIPDVSGFAGIAWSPDGTRFAARVDILETAVVRVYAAQSGDMLVEIPSSKISQLAWSPMGNQLVFEWPHAVQIWSADSGEVLRTLDASMDSEVELQFSPTENLIAFVNLDNSDSIIEIWNTDTGQREHQLEGERISGFYWNEGGLVSTSFNDTIRIWDTQTYQEIRRFQVGRFPFVEMSADGTWLLVQDDSTGIHTRDAITGEILGIFDRHQNPSPATLIPLPVFGATHAAPTPTTGE